MTIILMADPDVNKVSVAGQTTDTCNKRLAVCLNRSLIFLVTRFAVVIEQLTVFIKSYATLSLSHQHIHLIQNARRIKRYGLEWDQDLDPLDFLDPGMLGEFR